MENSGSFLDLIGGGIITGGGIAENCVAGGGERDGSFSVTILPPLLLVFSTSKALTMPCWLLPNPWPSLNPYLAIIFAATELPPIPPKDGFGGPVGIGRIGPGSVSKDGGGAIAAPPVLLWRAFSCSSSSSSSISRLRAKPVSSL